MSRIKLPIQKGCLNVLIGVRPESLSPNNKIYNDFSVYRLEKEHPALLKSLIKNAISDSHYATILTNPNPFVIELINIHLMRYKIEGLTMAKHLNEIYPLNPDNLNIHLINKDKPPKNLLIDGLIDNVLLSDFNPINDLYDSMRDIEFNQ